MGGRQECEASHSSQATGIMGPGGPGEEPLCTVLHQPLCGTYLQVWPAAVTPPGVARYCSPIRSGPHQVCPLLWPHQVWPHPVWPPKYARYFGPHQVWHATVAPPGVARYCGTTRCGPVLWHPRGVAPTSLPTAPTTRCGPVLWPRWRPNDARSSAESGQQTTHNASCRSMRNHIQIVYKP